MCTLLGGVNGLCKYQDSWWGDFASDCTPDPVQCEGGDICESCADNYDDADSCNMASGGGYCQWNDGSWWFLWLDSGCEQAGRCSLLVWVPVGPGECEEQPIESAGSFGYVGMFTIDGVTLTAEEKCINDSFLIEGFTAQ
jgi:hypothetical protein